MKKILMLIFLFITGIIFFLLYLFMMEDFPLQERKNHKSNTNQIPPTIINKNENIIELTIREKRITASWIKVIEQKKLFLYPNFSEKLSAEEFKNKNKCESVISGGFYYENNIPIGLFNINNEIISNEIKNNFFNGFFYVSSDEKVGIRREIDNLNFRFAMQSGPILLEKNSPLELKIINDEEERRIVVAVNKESEIFFIVFYKSDFEVKGPLLSEVPDLLKELEIKTGESYETALNLDGGTASAFYASGISLREITSVGSFFCIK